MMSREQFGEDAFDARLRSLFYAAERQTVATENEQLRMVEAVLERIAGKQRMRMGLVGGAAGFAAAVSAVLLSRLQVDSREIGFEPYLQNYIMGVERLLQWLPATDMLVLSAVSAGLAGLAYVICRGVDVV